MIDLKAGRITDILPENLAKQTEVQAIAYAAMRQVAKLVDFADNSRTYAAVETMPEKLLDILAVELRTPAYDENFPVTIKRELLGGSLAFFMQMGTPAAVTRIIQIIFGTGYIKEWFDYNGSPYHFKAYTTNPAITQDDVEEFKRVLASVGRLSAHLDDIILELATPSVDVTFACWVHTGDFIRLQRADL